jgi:hypothetical protein
MLNNEFAFLQDAANGALLINAAMSGNVNEVQNLITSKKANVNFKNSVSCAF